MENQTSDRSHPDPEANPAIDANIAGIGRILQKIEECVQFPSEDFERPTRVLLAHMPAALNQLIKSLTDLKRDISESIRELNEKSSTLTTELVELRNIRNQYAAEQQSHANATRELRRREDELATVRAQFDEEKHARHNIAAELQKCKGELECVRTRFDAEQLAHVNAAAGLRTLETQIKVVRSQLECLDKRYIEECVTNGSKLTELKTLQNAYSQLQNLAVATQARLDDSNEELRKAHVQLRNASSDFSSRTESVRADLQATVARVKELEEASVRHNERVQKLNESNATLTKDLREQRETNTRLETEMVDRQRALETQKAEWQSDLRDRKAAFEAEISNLKAELGYVRVQVGDKAEELAAAQAEMATMSDEQAQKMNDIRERWKDRFLAHEQRENERFKQLQADMDTQWENKANSIYIRGQQDSMDRFSSTIETVLKAITEKCSQINTEDRALQRQVHEQELARGKEREQTMQAHFRNRKDALKREFQSEKDELSSQMKSVTKRNEELEMTIQRPRKDHEARVKALKAEHQSKLAARPTNPEIESTSAPMGARSRFLTPVNRTGTGKVQYRKRVLEEDAVQESPNLGITSGFPRSMNHTGTDTFQHRKRALEEDATQLGEPPNLGTKRPSLTIPIPSWSGTSGGGHEDDLSADDPIQSIEYTPSQNERQSQSEENNECLGDLPQDPASRLRSMFYFAWDKTEEEEELIISYFESLFSRRREVDSVANAVDKYCQRKWNIPFPPGCLIAYLKGIRAGSGGSMTQKTCPHCSKHKMICLWAKYAPGVSETSDPDHTVNIGGEAVRWILKKRKTSRDDRDDAPWMVGNMTL